MSEYKGRPDIRHSPAASLDEPETGGTPLAQETEQAYEKEKREVMAALDRLQAESLNRPKFQEKLFEALEGIKNTYKELFESPSREEEYEEDFDEPAVIANLVKQYAIRQPNGKNFIVFLRESSFEYGKRLSLMMDEVSVQPGGSARFEETQVVARFRATGEEPTLVPSSPAESDFEEPKTLIPDVSGDDTLVPEEPTRILPPEPPSLLKRLGKMFRRS